MEESHVDLKHANLRHTCVTIALSASSDSRATLETLSEDITEQAINLSVSHLQSLLIALREAPRC